MLCGKPPFNAENDLEVMRLIKIGKYYIGGSVWDRVSAGAKDLVMKLLEYNPAKRFTIK